MSQAGEIDVVGSHPEIPTEFVADVGFAVPIANTIELLTDIAIAGTTPFQSTGSGNTITHTIQISQAIAATDATKIGLSNFDSSAFDVDANGFVQLNGGGIATTSFDVQANTAPGTDPVVPSATGAVTVNGAAVANHSVVLETRSRAANAFNLEVQYATSAASTDATKSGVAHFDSTDFTVDANGFVAANPSIPNYVQIATVDSPYTVLSTDYFISCNSGGGVMTVRLPNSPTLYHTFVIKDRTGTADTQNITVTTVGGVVTIDGSTSYVMDEEYESIEVLWNGTSYEIF